MAQELGTVYNATPSPLIVDHAGRVIGASSFGVAPVNEQPAKGQLEAGQLVEVTIPDEQLDDDSIAEGARAAARARHERAGTTPRKRRASATTTTDSTAPDTAATTPPTTTTEA